MKVNPEIQKLLSELLDQYTKEVKNAGLKENTEQTYLLHANHFVRWCNGDFAPGQKLKKNQPRGVKND